jgi:hypothetical protein
MSKTEKHTHGGRREGAGRPRKDNVMLRAMVKPSTMETLKQRAAAANLLVGEYIETLLVK